MLPIWNLAFLLSHAHGPCSLCERKCHLAMPSACAYSVCNLPVIIKGYAIVGQSDLSFIVASPNSITEPVLFGAAALPAFHATTLAFHLCPAT